MVNQLEKMISIYNRMIREYLNRELRPYNLSESNFYYVLFICDQPGISQKQLLHQLFRQQSIVTKAVNYLIKNDWIEMVIDPNDKRQRLLYPTEHAKTVYPAIKKIAMAGSDYAQTGLTPTETETLNYVVEKAVKHLAPPDQSFE